MTKEQKEIFERIEYFLGIIKFRSLDECAYQLDRLEIELKKLRAELQHD